MASITAGTPALLANGLLGTAMTGLIRIPALLSTVTAVAMVGEIVLRGLGAVLEQVGFEPKADSWISKSTSWVSDYINIRPYQDRTLWSTQKLVLNMIAFAAIGIVATEFARLIGGAIPPIYNNVLTFLGPVRLDSAPYLDSVRSLLASRF